MFYECLLLIQKINRKLQILSIGIVVREYYKGRPVKISHYHLIGKLSVYTIGIIDITLNKY